MFIETVADVLEELKEKVGQEFFDTHNYALAAQLFSEISLKEDFTDFLTLKAYTYLD
jgi:malate synthase